MNITDVIALWKPLTISPRESFYLVPLYEASPSPKQWMIEFITGEVVVEWSGVF